MSAPDGIDERFGTLLGELRSGEAAAGPELRERVRAIATRGPEPPARRWGRRLPRFRLALVLVPLIAALALAVGLGAFSSSGSSPPQKLAGGVAHGSGATASHEPPLPLTTRTAMPPSLHRSDAPKAAQLAPSGSRAQLYSADLRLRVSDLSGTTKQAIRLTRSFGGYVLSVDYGSAQQAGEASLVLRVPIVEVQTALAKLTALGSILADHVSIQDVQGQLNRRFARIADLRARIASLQAKLANTGLTADERAFFAAAIANRQALLARLQSQQTAEKTRAGFATVALDLQTRKAAVVAPSKPSRIGRALHNIGRVLVVEAEILLYVLLIGAPFVVLAALIWATRRGWRRRSEEQLLAR